MKREIDENIIVIREFSISLQICSSLSNLKVGVCDLELYNK